MAKIGLIQADVSLRGSREEKQDRLLLLARQCLQQGADLVFFPEAYQHVQDRGIIFDRPRLEENFARWKERCAALAKEFHAYVVPWDYEPGADGKVYNCSYIIDRNGGEVGRYRKTQLTHSEIIKGISNGEDIPVFDLDFGRVGIMICFDNYWPEVAAVLGRKGAQLILYPLYGDTLFPGWELKMRARAADHCCYVASSQIDRPPRTAYTGLISPTGEILAKLEPEEGCAVVEIPLEPVKTHTTGVEAYTELLHPYLERCRNAAVFSPLCTQTDAPASWEEIFCGKIPPVDCPEDNPLHNPKA